MDGITKFPVEYKERFKADGAIDVEIGYRIHTSKQDIYKIGRLQAEGGKFYPVIFELLKKENGKVIRRSLNIFKTGENKYGLFGRRLPINQINEIVEKIANSLFYFLSTHRRRASFDEIKNIINDAYL